MSQSEDRESKQVVPNDFRDAEARSNSEHKRLYQNIGQQLTDEKHL